MTENALIAIRIGMLNFDIIVESHCYVLIPKEGHMHPLVSGVALVLCSCYFTLLANRCMCPSFGTLDFAQFLKPVLRLVTFHCACLYKFMMSTSYTVTLSE